MISNKTKILIGGSGIVILLICIVLILVMTKSSKTSTSGMCGDGKSKILCSDNISRCPDDCPVTVTCPKDQTLVRCNNGTKQCASSCNTGLSWFCQDKDIAGSCQPNTGGTGGPVLPDGKCEGEQIKIKCDDGTFQCADCAPNRSWNCKTKECENQNCCGTSSWDSTLKTCVGNDGKHSITACSDPNKVPNSDKTKCINECRLDGTLASTQCYDETPDSSIYFDRVKSTLKNGRTFCYKTLPAHVDSSQLCYHSKLGGRACLSTDNWKISNELANMEAKGWIQGAGGCNGLYAPDYGDDCYMYMVNKKVAGSNFLSNPDYPVYLYLEDNKGPSGYWQNSFTRQDRENWDQKPIQCWSTENPDSGISLSSDQDNWPSNIQHLLPLQEDATYFCDNVLSDIVAK